MIGFPWLFRHMKQFDCIGLKFSLQNLSNNTQQLIRPKQQQQKKPYLLFRSLHKGSQILTASIIHSPIPRLGDYAEKVFPQDCTYNITKSG